MKREYLAVRKKNKTIIYGVMCAALFGDLSWAKLGTITFNEKYGEYFFDWSWRLIKLSEKTIRVIDCEIARLNREHGKV